MLILSSMTFSIAKYQRIKEINNVTKPGKFVFPVRSGGLWKSGDEMLIANCECDCDCEC